MRSAHLRVCQAGKPDLQYVRLSSLTRERVDTTSQGNHCGNCRDLHDEYFCSQLRFDAKHRESREYENGKKMERKKWPFGMR